MKRKFTYDPRTGRWCLTESTLIILAVIAGLVIVGVAYCIGWGAGFAVLGLSVTAAVKKYWGLPLTDLQGEDST